MGKIISHITYYLTCNCCSSSRRRQSPSKIEFENFSAPTPSTSLHKMVNSLSPQYSRSNLWSGVNRIRVAAPVEDDGRYGSLSTVDGASTSEFRTSIDNRCDESSTTPNDACYEKISNIRVRNIHTGEMNRNTSINMDVALVCLDFYPLHDHNDAHQKLLSNLKYLSTRVYVYSSEQDFLAVFDRPNIETLCVIICGSDNLQETCSKIYHVRSIQSIYVCNYMNSNSVETPIVISIRSIQAIYNTIPELIIKLEEDMKSLHDQLLSATLMISHHTPEQSLRNLNAESASFLWFQLLLDIILRMPSSYESRMSLVEACRLYYHDNLETQRQIYSFEHTYHPSDALKWYSSNSFIYRLLNRALRCQHIDSIYVFRSYIADLHKQLTELCNEYMEYVDYCKVYRGQTLTLNELNMIRDNVGGLVSMNSFCSATLNPTVASVYLQRHDNQDNLESVLFEIDIDLRIKTKPFAYIGQFSHFPDEEEVLFSLGSIFRINSLTYDCDEKYWHINLIACSTTDESVTNLIQSYQNEFADKDGSFSLLSLGNMLQSMGQYNKSETFYKMMLDQLPSSHPDVKTIYLNIGALYLQRGDFDQALSMYHHNLLSTFSLEDSSWASALNNMGLLYYERRDLELALRCYQMSLVNATSDSSTTSDPLHVAVTYNNIGLVYASLRNYDQALTYYSKSLTELSHLLPMNHPRIGKMYNNIASVKSESGDYDNAINDYQKALDIYRRTLPEHHPDILLTLQNLAIVYWTTGHLGIALIYFQRALDTAVHSLAPDHRDLIALRSSISTISAELQKMT